MNTRVLGELVGRNVAFGGVVGGGDNVLDTVDERCWMKYGADGNV